MATSCTSPTPVTTSGGRLWILSWLCHKLFFSKQGHNLIIILTRLENCCQMVKRLAWVLFLPSRGNQNFIVISTLIESYSKDQIVTEHNLKFTTHLRWERKMKMKNRKLVFGGQGGGHGRSSTSLDRWADFYNLWDLGNPEMALLVIFSVLAYWAQKKSSVTKNQLRDHL